MRTKLFISILPIFFLLCITLLSSCSFLNTDGGGDSGAESSTEAPDKAYTIRYNDGKANQTITVHHGDVYSLSSIPEKAGHEFLGLFDAENGGTQYVNAKGNALSPFTDRQNLVLFPQFKALEFTVVLNFEGASVGSHNRSMVVAYGASIPPLPTNLSVENKSFTGWYTAAGRGGKQVADAEGNLPQQSILNEENFDLSSAYVNLYAGFKGVEHTVIFHFGDSFLITEEVLVEHGTSISNVTTETRVNNMGVLKWAKDTDGTDIFTGRVTTDDLRLYAVEYAPIIDFDTDGGNTLPSIVSKAGEAITLPTPKKTYYEFAGWVTADGTAFTSSTMPAESQKLTARWKATISFNENGGTTVSDICESTGTSITLPTPTRSGYIFAGWYTETNEKYESAAMPEHSILLKAGWYAVKTKKIVVISDSEKYGGDYITQNPSMDKSCHTVDLSDLYDAGVRTINVTAHYRSYANGSVKKPKTTYMSWYSQKSASNAYKIWGYSEEHVDENWGTYTQQTTLTLSNGTVYICRYSSYDYYNHYFYWQDFWLEIEYPDTSNLIL